MLDPDLAAPRTWTFRSVLYLAGATLFTALVPLLVFGAVQLGGVVGAIMGLVALAFGLGVVMATGRGHVTLALGPDALVVRRWLRPALRLPLRPRAPILRAATHLDKAIGPVLVADEARSRRIHAVIDTLMNQGERGGLEVSGNDEEFMAVEWARADGSPRVVLVPVRNEAARERAREVERALGSAASVHE